MRRDGTLVCWGANGSGEATPPFPTATHVQPEATFAAPASVAVGTAISLALTGAVDPGYTGVPIFTYAFDCGDGSGYGVSASAASQSCPTSIAGSRAVRGKVIDQDGDFSEYSAAVTISAAPGATASGTNVAVTPVDPGTGLTRVTLTFATVTAPGTTTVSSAALKRRRPWDSEMGSPPI